MQKILRYLGDFSFAIPPFCVSENDTMLQALQYLPAFYPLLLIVVFIELHDRVVVWMWRPFQRCLTSLQRPSQKKETQLRWNPKASTVSTFATFLTVA